MTAQRIELLDFDDLSGKYDVDDKQLERFCDGFNSERTVGGTVSKEQLLQYCDYNFNDSIDNCHFIGRIIASMFLVPVDEDVDLSL